MCSETESEKYVNVHVFKCISEWWGKPSQKEDSIVHGGEAMFWFISQASISFQAGMTSKPGCEDKYLSLREAPEWFCHGFVLVYFLKIIFSC